MRKRTRFQTGPGVLDTSRMSSCEVGLHAAAPGRASWRSAARDTFLGCNSCASGGFSLLELLIVISMIALLTSLLLPALKSARAEGQRISCENSLKQLGYSVQMYTADNDGKLPENSVGSNAENNWVFGNMSLWQEATNLVLIRRGKLFPYATHVGVYRCPADRSQTNSGPRVRSYSMNGWLGTRYMEPYSRQTGYRTFMREAELAAARPSAIWVLMDEHELSINDAWFQVTMDDSRPFASRPATRHGRGYDLNFADGHVEHYKLTAPENAAMDIAAASFSAKNPDWLRLKSVTTVR